MIGWVSAQPHAAAKAFQRLPLSPQPLNLEDPDCFFGQSQCTGECPSARKRQADPQTCELGFPALAECECLGQLDT